MARQELLEFIRIIQNIDENRHVTIDNILSLTKLVISETDVVSIPDTLVNLKTLECIDCELLTNIPRSLVDLKILNISGCLLITDIPDTLVNLEGLNCSSCPLLTEIPETLVNLTFNLICRECPLLTNIPNTLVNLTGLYCDDCPELTEIPETLVNLEEMYCSGCTLIQTIPRTFVNLERLGCEECPRIREIPDTLVNLEELSCSRCPLIRSIPRTFVKLINLSCEYCPLMTSIPVTLVNLEELLCEGCPNLIIHANIMAGLENCEGEACHRASPQPPPRVATPPPRVTIESKLNQLLALSPNVRYNLNQLSWDRKKALQSSVGCFDEEEGTLCDVNDQSDYKNQDYLKQDLGNLIFMIPAGDGFKAYGTHVSAIVYDKNTDIFLFCSKVAKGTQGAYHYAPLGGEIKSFNLNLNELYVILRFDYQIYVSLEDLIGALESGQRVFLLKQTSNPVVTLSPTVSYSTAYGFKNNIPYNTVSGDHCQEGTGKILSRIYVCVGANC